MTVNIDTAQIGEKFYKLGGLNTASATPQEEYNGYVRISLKRPHLYLHQLPEFQKLKHDLPIALAGGGPSIKKCVAELHKHKTVVACGSSHDWLIEQGIEPRYCVIADPDPKITPLYLKRPCPNTTYLIATQCPEEVFKAVEGYPIVMWHCHGEGYKELLDEAQPNWQAVGGGCTAGLRALSIVIMLGYRNTHMFGFDSSLGWEDEHHAYAFQTETEELGVIYNLKKGFGTPGERTYRCAGYHLAQAQHFKDFWTAYAGLFTPTFHGEGLLPDMGRAVQAESIRLAEVETARIKDLEEKELVA